MHDQLRCVVDHFLVQRGHALTGPSSGKGCCR
jgi:hypothetical protein